MYFPGGYAGGQDPFATGFSHVVIRALEQSGALVLRVHYDDSVLEPDRERFESGVRRELRGAIAYHRPDRLTVVGKSRGTHALSLVCTEDFPLPTDTRMIWLTPVWRADESWKAASANSVDSLHIVGLADHQYHLPDRHSTVTGETVEIPNADHGLEISGDIIATLNAWRTMAEAILRFASRTANQDLETDLS